MIISSKKILDLNKTYNLIENLCERELNPEGVGFDVRVGEVYKIKGDSFLGIENRNTPDKVKIADLDGENSNNVVLNPRDFVLIRTIEKVNLPSEKIVIGEGRLNMHSFHLMLDVYPRSTLQRCGIYFKGTKTDPGYDGKLTFALKNLGDTSFNLEVGARVANLVFKGVIGDARPYQGQWQDGRVTTKGPEVQR